MEYTLAKVEDVINEQQSRLKTGRFVDNVDYNTEDMMYDVVFNDGSKDQYADYDVAQLLENHKD